MKFEKNLFFRNFEAMFNNGIVMNKTTLRTFMKRVIRKRNFKNKRLKKVLILHQQQILKRL